MGAFVPYSFGMRANTGEQRRLRGIIYLIAIAGIAFSFSGFQSLAADDDERREKKERKERAERKEKREKREKRENGAKERKGKEAKRERPRRSAEREQEELPEGLRGFSGQVGLIVVGKGDGPMLIAEVAKVHKVWENNKASKPESLEGRKIRIGPGWQKNDAGKWHKIPLHVSFIRAFPVKEDARLEIRNIEGHGFNILELNEHQREFARSRAKREGDRPKKDKEEHESDDRIRKLEKELEALRKEIKKLREDR